MLEGETLTQKHAVVFYSDPRDEGSPFVVAPRAVLAQKGDSVFFQNVSNVDISVQFAAPSPFERETIELAAGGKETATINSMECRVHACDVYSGKSREEALNARPIIIIYDMQR